MLVPTSVIAKDTSGGLLEGPISTLKPLVMKIGHFGFSQQDIVVPVNNMPLTLIRTYNSLNNVSRDFAYSWSYTIADVDMEIDEFRVQTQDLFGNSFSLRTGGGRNVTLTMPDSERRVTFTYSLEPVPGSFGFHSIRRSDRRRPGSMPPWNRSARIYW